MEYDRQQQQRTQPLDNHTASNIHNIPGDGYFEMHTLEVHHKQERYTCAGPMRGKEPKKGSTHFVLLSTPTSTFPITSFRAPESLPLILPRNKLFRSHGQAPALLVSVLTVQHSPEKQVTPTTNGAVPCNVQHFTFHSSVDPKSVAKNQRGSVLKAGRL